VSADDDPAAPIAEELKEKRRRKPLLPLNGPDKFEDYKEREDVEFVPEPPTY
jgi:hypothetical protein